MKQTAEQLADRVRRGQMRARSLVEEALGRAEAVADLHAFIRLLPNEAIARAEQVDAHVAQGRDPGMLAGVPIVVKDNIDVAGSPTTAGTPAIDYVPTLSAPIVERLQAAGAVVIGKTNMHELAFGVTSDNKAFGTVRNPVDPSRYPGGSSGGTAAAIAAGVVCAGLGTDTAGSVRVPAALTGIAGLRPSTRAIPSTGIVPSVPAFDVAGPMGESVADVAALFGVMTGTVMPEPRPLDGMRLGIAMPHARGVSPTTAAAFERAVETLRISGISTTTVDLGPMVTASFEVGSPIGYFEMKAAMAAYLAAHVPGVDLQTMVDRIASPDVKRVYVESVLGTDAPDEASYQGAMDRLASLRNDYLTTLDQAGVHGLIYPTAPLEAQRIADGAGNVTLDGAEVPMLQAYLRNVVVASIVGAPGLSIPLPVGAGVLPVGLALDGRPGGDADVLAMGFSMEAALIPRG